MGVDYIACEECGGTFPDCGDWFLCTGCESSFCGEVCGGKKIEEKRPDFNDDYFEECTSCVLCRREHATDRTLLNFLLRINKMTYAQILEAYKNDTIPDGSVLDLENLLLEKDDEIDRLRAKLETYEPIKPVQKFA